MSFNYSFEIFESNEALSPYGIIETKSPIQETLTTNDFIDGSHFRTGPETETNALMLQLEDRLLTIVLDESGSMTWNDNAGDRYVYLKRLLSKLNATYPGQINANLIGFGGALTKTNLFLAQAGTNLLTVDGENFEQFLQSSFQDSVFDFAGVRVIRRTDRFPTHPADGVVVGEGIFESIKDDDLAEGTTYYYGVFAFNKQLNFSRGKFVKSTPYDRILPQGVNFASATPRVLPGAERDEYTQLIYNFTEGSGTLIFDSSGNGLHGSLQGDPVEDNFWAGDAVSSSYTSGALKKAVGVRFDGEFDLIETTVGEAFDVDPTLASKNLTINFWIYPYTRTETQWIIGTSTQSASNDIGWMLGIQPDGFITYAMGDLGSLQAPHPFMYVPDKQWTMVSVVMYTFAPDAILCIWYLNGVQVFGNTASTTSFSTGTNTLYIGGKPESSSAAWSGSDFFGSLAQVSVHNTIRDEDYIAALYARELPIFQQTINSAVQSPPDNNQREVLLNWSIGTDYDYEGGSVNIVRKHLQPPAHIDDGDLVAQIDASPGEFYYMDSYDFVHNSNYYYRMFSVNSFGLPCDRLEARLLSTHIPRSKNSSPNPALSQTSNETITPGNKKLLLQWVNPVNDLRWAGTRIYYSNSGFPVVSLSSNGTIEISNGTLIVDTSDTSFAHRTVGIDDSGSDIPLCNGRVHYYTFITYDKLGRLSEPRFAQAIPSSQLDTVFTPNDVSDLYPVILNPTTVSLKWTNPTVRSDQLDLYFGESALCFVSVRDLYGGVLDDVTNMKLQVCTSLETRGLKTTETSLGNSNDEDDSCGTVTGTGTGSFGSTFDPDCNSEQAAAETILNYATVESGLIKGVLGHTANTVTLSRRKKYTMDVRAQYRVVDPDNTDQSLFEFNTRSARVSFRHPLKISIINKKNKRVTIRKQDESGLRGQQLCKCPPQDGESSVDSITFNGGYINATQPYVARVELQYKGEALPEGTTVNVHLFKHGNNYPLNEKSSRTFIREGIYPTRQVIVEETDAEGEPTGQTVSKSVVDIEVPHPTEPDHVDLYVALDFLGFVVDAVQEIKFIASVFISTDITQPRSDGIHVPEQFATVWIVNPDFPDDETKRLPAPDGTIVKWDLVKFQYSKERPFYSTEDLPQTISGVYSLTRSGVARNVFFGPIGNIESHVTVKKCGQDDPGEPCCIGEEYAIKASVIIGESSATDGVIFSYACKTEQEFSNKRFLMDAANAQPGSNPHWVTWADGLHLLKFQIASNPALSTMSSAECFNDCTDAISPDQTYELPLNSIVQVTAPGEIMWDVVFQEDPYTGEQTPVSYQSISPQIAEDLGIPFVANIPIRGATTDFYLRYNTFIGDGNNPKPQECESGNSSGGIGSDGDVLLPCEWKNVCDSVQSSCSPTTGQKWVNVAPVSGQTTIIINNKPVTLFGGGTYEDGIPPLYAGFKEPLDVRIIEARVNGGRVDELIVDGFSRHTFVVEVTFANEPVPDGTTVEIEVEGKNQSVVILSNCAGVLEGCSPIAGGVTFTRQVNDPLINPSGSVRSLAYFTIEPIPNIAFNAKIKVRSHYDKIGTTLREVERCIELNNTVNVQPPDEPPCVGDCGNDDTDPSSIPESETPTSNDVIIYDTVLNQYVRTRGMRVQRLAHFSAASTLGTADSIYVFGGKTGGESFTSSITPLCEVFDTTTQQWEFIADMPTARAAGMTAQSGNNVYCIGGIELDPITNQFAVSRKIESYNIVSGLWNETLAPMPEEYGVAFGSAHSSDGYIYVLGGVTEMVNNSQPGTTNNKILRYDIANDSWITITPSDVELYQRISHFGFFRSSPTISSIPDSEIIESDQSEVVGPLPTYVGDSAAQDGLWTGALGGQLYVGNTGNQLDAYARWEVNVPKGATVTSATISALQLDNSGDASGLVILIDSDNYTTDFPSSGPGAVTGISLTNTQVFWEFNANTSSYESSPDIRDIIQAFIDRPGYEPGNIMAIKLQGSSGIIGIGPASEGDSMLLDISYAMVRDIYAYGGSIPKTQTQIDAERTNRVNKLLDEFRSFILTSSYFQNLLPSQQESFIEEEEKRIQEGVLVAPYVYVLTGYHFTPGSETNTGAGWTLDISNTVDDEWPVLPMPRDRGQAVYIPHQDVAYFMGGANQNQSTTLNRVESIDFSLDGEYARRTPLSRGRSLFHSSAIGDEIYLTGGLTSGHKSGYVQLDVTQSPNHIETLGTQSSGILITLRNDSGEIVEEDVRVAIRGRLRIPEIDSVLADFLADRAADRALGGDGTGTATDLPEPGEEIDISRLIEAQNKVTDPNSDEFQFNAARKLSEDVVLFPVLYSNDEITLVNGVGGVTLRPRSEDPLADLEKLAQYIQDVLQTTPEDSDETFQGDLTREELAALGDALSTVQLPPTIINSGSLRNLYDIETTVTVLDRDLFGETVSQFDLDIQSEIESKIEEKLTPPPPTDDETTTANLDGQSAVGLSGGRAVTSTECFLLQHVVDPDVQSSIESGNDGGGTQGGGGSAGPRNPGGTGSSNETGQCFWCKSILPINASTRVQNQTTFATFFNHVDWIPQIRNRIVDNATSLTDAIAEIDIIDHETPFGGSQLYNAMFEAGRITAGDSLNDLKKSIYICSDNSPNLSITTRDRAIEEINAIDGDKKVPVVYTVFSTSFPVSLSTQLQRSLVGDVEKITQQTGGQSTTLIASGFLDQILNLTLGGATGGLGYGIYSNKIEFEVLTAVTDLTTDFDLPANTQGYIRYRYTADGFNFTDWSERFEGSQTVDFIDFFAKVIEFEVTLTTGFTADVTEEYDATPTGIPKLRSIVWTISGEREDFMFLNKESVLTNAQQAAVAFEGTIPRSGIVEIGVATSNSHNWADYHTAARPAVQEFGKIFLLDRTDTPDSVVPAETLSTDDQILYKTTYGGWDPKSSVELIRVQTDGTEVPVLSGFALYPRDGQIYFDTRQDPSNVYKMYIINSDCLRIGLRLRNRLHTDSINIQGVGYIYSTNDVKPLEISQVAPRAINVQLSPQTPTSGDTFFALYDFVDLNGDKESGTIISWFKNGEQLLEIQNLSTWSDNDLLLNNKLQPNDRISFSVTPSDGRDFGATVFSSAVIIVPREPGADDVRLVPRRDGIINSRFDTSSSISVDYVFETDDTGSAALEVGTIIRWYVNGVLFKEGVFSEATEPDENAADPKSLLPNEVVGGVVAHTIGNQIYAEVTPKTLLITGTTVRSQTVIIENTVPRAYNVILSPLAPTVKSTLQVSFQVDDIDILIGNQTDQTEIKWYSSANGIDFAEDDDLRNATTASSAFLRAGQRWYVEITPFDGLDVGVIARSNTVIVSP